MRSTLEEVPDGHIWKELSPLLDAAMARLGTTDRDALVLRYFENKTLSEVGAALGMEERAAQKRVTRALEKLRTIFAQRGLALTAAVIAGSISKYSVQAAPNALAATISATPLTGSGVADSIMTLVKGTLHIMSRTKTKIAAAVAASSLLIASAVVAFRHHYPSQGERYSVQADQAQPRVEQEGKLAKVAADRGAQKTADDREALPERRN